MEVNGETQWKEHKIGKKHVKNTSKSTRPPDEKLGNDSKKQSQVSSSKGLTRPGYTEPTKDGSTMHHTSSIDAAGTASTAERTHCGYMESREKTKNKIVKAAVQSHQCGYR